MEKIGFNEEYRQEFETKESVDSYTQNYMKGQFDYVLEFFKKSVAEILEKPDNTENNLHLLDVGCGSGRQTTHFAKYFEKVTAVDISEAQIAKAKAAFPRKNVTYKVGTSSDFPVDDVSIDVISCIFSAQYFPDMDKFVSECNRVLKPGGFVGIWSDTNDNVVLESKSDSETEKMSKQLCAELLEYYKKYTAEVGHFGWYVFDHNETLLNSITGMNKSMKKTKYYEVMTLEGFISATMGIPLYLDVKLVWNKFIEKLKQLWNLESIENKDIRVRVTRAAHVIVLTKK